jgi:ribulose 1,5-bisphosphate synthetase/thiazole synthase
MRSLTSSSRESNPLASSSAHYDLIVIGSGPAAQKCAADSAKSGKRVAVIDKKVLQQQLPYYLAQLK